jgi:hypothetical protein
MRWNFFSFFLYFFLIWFCACQWSSQFGGLGFCWFCQACCGNIKSLNVTRDCFPYGRHILDQLHLLRVNALFLTSNWIYLEYKSSNYGMDGAAQTHFLFGRAILEEG